MAFGEFPATTETAGHPSPRRRVACRIMTPRIPPGRFRELGPTNWALWRMLSTISRVPDAHLFSTLGRTRGLFRGWLHYSGRLMSGGVISRHETELVIIRIAHLRDCAYEMDHHVRLGRRAGVTPVILQHVLDGPDADGWSPRHRALLAAVDELVAIHDLSDATWVALAEHFDDRQMIEFCLLAAQYDGLATTIGVLRLDRDF